MFMAMVSEPIRVLVVDDHEMFSDALSLLLGRQPEFELAGAVSGAEEALECAGELQPDVVLMDASMPGVSGLEAARRIGREHPTIRIIMLLPTLSADYERAALKVGASASVAKDRLDEDLLSAISSVTSSR